jgi:hypothetical protein
MRCLSVDLGFAACGVALMGHDDAGVTLDNTKLLTTKREARRLMLHQSSDDARRIDVLVEELMRLRAVYQPDLIAYELPSGSRGASQARALGYAHGIIRAVGRGVRMVEVPVLDARRWVAGVAIGRVTEEQAHAIVVSRYPWLASVSVHERDAVVVGLAAMRR